MPVIHTVRPLLLPLARAVDWTPLLVSGTVMPALMLLTVWAFDMTPDDMLIVLRATGLLLGAAAAFTLVDDMAVNAAALPSPRWLRQWLRTLLAVGAAAIGWTATYLVGAPSLPGDVDVPLADVALEAAVCVAVGLAGAAFAVRRLPERHGALAGTATLFAASITVLFLPSTWSPWPWPGDPRWDAAHTGWLLALPVTMAALTFAHRDTLPVGRALRWPGHRAAVAPVCGSRASALALDRPRARDQRDGAVGGDGQR